MSSPDTPTSDVPASKALSLNEIPFKFEFKIDDWPSIAEEFKLTKVTGVESIDARIQANGGRKEIACLPHPRVKLIYIGSTQYSNDCKSLYCKLSPLQTNGSHGVYQPQPPQYQPQPQPPQYQPQPQPPQYQPQPQPPQYQPQPQPPQYQPQPQPPQYQPQPQPPQYQPQPPQYQPQPPQYQPQPQPPQYQPQPQPPQYQPQPQPPQYQPQPPQYQPQPPQYQPQPPQYQPQPQPPQYQPPGQEKPFNPYQPEYRPPAQQYSQQPSSGVSSYSQGGLWLNMREPVLLFNESLIKWLGNVSVFTFVNELEYDSDISLRLGYQV